MTINFVKPKSVPMRGHAVLTERWLQEQIAEDPTLLGLGDLVVRDKERRQPHAGRLDLLLSDPETQTRYEVEIQLGPTDESHIIRTIEYWDIEKRRYPNYEHVAVLAAEDVTGRFVNVISLFNGFIPLIAVQLRAIEVADHHTLVATKVVDLITLGTDEEDEPGEPTDRNYWETKRSNPQSMHLADRLLELIREDDPEVEYKYNKYYVGLARNGAPDNYISVRPRKTPVLLSDWRIERDDDLAARIEDAGLDVLGYSARWGRYRIRVSERDLEENVALLRELIAMARNDDDDE